MRFYRRVNDDRPVRKYFEFIGNYLLLLLCSLVVGLAFYYVFELTRSHSWLTKVIGTVIPTLVDALGFIPQIILVIKRKSAHGYSLTFILTDMLGSVTGIISVCLWEKIDIVPLISFIGLFLFQAILFVLKMIIFRGREARQSNQISPMEKSQMPGK